MQTQGTEWAGADNLSGMVVQASLRWGQLSSDQCGVRSSGERAFQKGGMEGQRSSDMRISVC